jgi:hypothetical protein
MVGGGKKETVEKKIRPYQIGQKPVKLGQNPVKAY